MESAWFSTMGNEKHFGFLILYLDVVVGFVRIFGTHWNIEVNILTALYVWAEVEVNLGRAYETVREYFEVAKIPTQWCQARLIVKYFGPTFLRNLRVHAV